MPDEGILADASIKAEAEKDSIRDDKVRALVMSEDRGQIVDSWHLINSVMKRAEKTGDEKLIEEVRVVYLRIKQLLS